MKPTVNHAPTRMVSTAKQRASRAAMRTASHPNKRATSRAAMRTASHPNKRTTSRAAMRTASHPNKRATSHAMKRRRRSTRTTGMTSRARLPSTPCRASCGQRSKPRPSPPPRRRSIPSRRLCRRCCTSRVLGWCSWRRFRWPSPPAGCSSPIRRRRCERRFRSRTWFFRKPSRRSPPPPRSLSRRAAPRPQQRRRPAPITLKRTCPSHAATSGRDTAPPRPQRRVPRRARRRNATVLRALARTRDASRLSRGA